MKMSAIKYNRVDVDGFGVAYREAGSVNGPALLLLHGFATSSHMFRDLIPRRSAISMTC
jgi:pimeloyl-ACP methyl ester carboxylesterase